jgi:hypothetical protein
MMHITCQHSAHILPSPSTATLVAQGSGIGIAISTGDFTQIGTINRLVNNTETIKTDVLKQIDMVSKYLFIAICTMCLATFFVAFFYSDNYKKDALGSINIALTCAVAMVPEGLEAIVTLTYSYAVKVMASQNAIVRALPPSSAPIRLEPSPRTSCLLLPSSPPMLVTRTTWMPMNVFPSTWFVMIPTSLNVPNMI